MTRPKGLGRTADVASDILVDDRILDAVEVVGPSAVVAYLGVITASWSRGERVALSSVVRRLPALYGDLTEAGVALAGAGLLDDDGMVPEPTWDSWYGGVRRRAEQLAELSVLGVAARRRKRSGAPSGDPDGNGHGDSNGNPHPPTYPPRPPLTGRGEVGSSGNGLDDDYVFDPAGADGPGYYRRAAG